MFHNKDIRELKEFKEYSSKQLIALQEDIIAAQKSTKEITSALNNGNKESALTDEEKIRAAYALNLCTVSVSQIVDYNDLNILEQEYDAILNNLNLEQMPKDEPLLKILKQILDTITFFRIQEGDKKFIEQDYQQKMKNAIWKAVPNLSVILATGNPVAMAVSLASQVGIGYMNYRKEKAETNREYDKQLWQLQRAAIEQFNALRRELFDTAWRLVDAYKIPDSYRLTEAQISQYNNILMEKDVYTKYKRLDAVKENFVAYPPFWYFKGQAANAIAQDNKQNDSIYTDFAKIAIEDFCKFQKANGVGLLRTDLISASCCLEYADLLDVEKDKDKIEKLLLEAAQFAGTHNDVKQLCAIGFLKIGSWENAKKYLEILIHENFNANANAQILSNIYCRDWLQGKDHRAKAQNDLLQHFIPSEYLYDLPELNLLPPPTNEKLVSSFYDECCDKFLDKQKEVVATKYSLVFDEFMKKYSSKINRIFQTPYADREYADEYFYDTGNACRKRHYEMKNMLMSQKDKKRYISNIAIYSVDGEYKTAVNNFANAIRKIYSVSPDFNLLKNSISEKTNLMNEFEESIQEADRKPETFTIATFELIKQLSFGQIVTEFELDYFDKAFNAIYDVKKLSELSAMEKILSKACADEGIDSPDILYAHNQALSKEGNKNDSYVDDFDLFQEDNVTRAKKNDQISICNKYSNPDENLLRKNKPKFIVEGNGNIKRYFLLKKKKIESLDEDHALINAFKDRNIIAILSMGDSGIKDDLFLTTDGILKYHSSKFELVAYSAVRFSDNEKRLVWGQSSSEKKLFCERDLVNMETLLCLFKDLENAQ